MPKPVSTRHLAALPDAEALRNRLQQMATLAGVVGIELGQGPYEFHPQWARGQQMGAYKNGSGDELFVHFTPAGCFIKGFAHESTMSPYRTNPPELWPALLDDVPSKFASSLKEPAFDIDATTFVIWRLKSDEEWQTGKHKFPSKDPDVDGSQDLLGHVTMNSNEFAEWLSEDCEMEVDPEIVAHVFDHRPLTKKQLEALQPEAKLSDLKRALNETGYPMA